METQTREEMSSLIFDKCLVVGALAVLRFHFSTEHTKVAVDIYQQNSELLILSEERFLKM